MGSPDNAQHKHDAMGDLGGLIVPAYIRHNFGDAQILDVGAGWGKYRKLLHEYPMDACEIWEPYVLQEGLNFIYDKVFVEDICDLEFEWYDVIVMGDVLEHIEEERAIKLIEDIKPKCYQLLVVAPYQYPQGTVDGNHYEIHKQADLTDENMRSRYGLKLLAKDDTKGVYIK